MIVFSRQQNPKQGSVIHPVFETEPAENAMIVTPVRGFDLLADHEFTAEVNRLLASVGPHPTKLVIDLHNATSCSSDRLLGPLVVLWNRVRKHHGKMTICGLCPYGREVMHRTRLDTIWPIYATREEALRACRDAA